MSGAWVTWPADVLTWPGVTDITPNLDAAVEALRWHCDIVDATYEYTPGARTVTLRLLVRWGITEVPAKGYAHAALRQGLPPVGLGVGRRDVGATLKLDWWSSDFDWWPWRHANRAPGRTEAAPPVAVGGAAPDGGHRASPPMATTSSAQERTSSSAFLAAQLLVITGLNRHRAVGGEHDADLCLGPFADQAPRFDDLDAVYTSTKPVDLLGLPARSRPCATWRRPPRPL